MCTKIKRKPVVSLLSDTNVAGKQGKLHGRYPSLTMGVIFKPDNHRSLVQPCFFGTILSRSEKKESKYYLIIVDLCKATVTVRVKLTVIRINREIQYGSLNSVGFTPSNDLTSDTG